MRISITASCIGTLLLMGCGDFAKERSAVATEGRKGAAGGEACPGDGGRLPITGICAGRAVNYLNTAGGKPPEAPEGCEWVVQETRFADSVLLYRATKCGRKTTRLAFAGGAGMAELSYDAAAYGDAENALKGQVLVRVASMDPADKTANVLWTARGSIDDPAEKAACRVRNAGIDGWPDDALVVDNLSASEAAAIANEGPRTACGPFGLDEDSSTFWRVFQEQSWFFQLGQDAWQIDPGSFTLLRQGKEGEWVQVE